MKVISHHLTGVTVRLESLKQRKTIFNEPLKASQKVLHYVTIQQCKALRHVVSWLVALLIQVSSHVNLSSEIKDHE